MRLKSILIPGGQPYVHTAVEFRAHYNGDTNDAMYRDQIQIPVPVPSQFAGCPVVQANGPGSAAENDASPEQVS